MVEAAIPNAEFYMNPQAVDFENLVKMGDFLGCLQCGLCAGSCPLGYAIEYSPRKIILNTRAGKLNEVLDDPSVWMCVSCYTCSDRCPKDIELTDILWPALRDKGLQEGVQPPAELQDAFQKIYLYGNSLGESPKKRLKWAQGLENPPVDLSKEKRPVDVLWMVECYPSYYPRNQVVTRHFARIMNTLGIDWGVLGNKEKCLGDCDRYYGEEGLFEMLIENNIELINQYEFNKLVVIDPHAYRALERFYPLYGAKYPAQHYCMFLAERLEELKPMLKHEVKAKVTYHDNCCIGRRCKCYQAPRDLLTAIPGIELVEMERNYDNALCCGGGGGGMWLDGHITEHGGHRLSDERIKMAAETEADIMAVSCPYELSRFEDSAKVVGLENKLVVRDIIELMAQSMGFAEGGHS
ncbi:(Fe-S)-binding protein [bacterium]|nr:(Fe-S)-binding protein [bacterium]